MHGEPAYPRCSPLERITTLSSPLETMYFNFVLSAYPRLRIIGPQFMCVQETLGFNTAMYFENFK